MRFFTTAIASLGLVAGVGLAPGMAAVANTAASGTSMTAPPSKVIPKAMSENSELREVPHAVPLHRVAVLQEALDSAGANLKVDGIWEPATEAALRQYQRQNGLQVTGELDQATRSRLAPIG